MGFENDEYVGRFHNLTMKRANGSSVRLRDVINFNPSISKPKNPVRPVRPEGDTAGYTTSTSENTFSMTVAVGHPKAEVDWHEVCDNDERFILEWSEGPLGVRRQMPFCVVDSVGDPYDNGDGELQRSIEGKGRRLRRVR